MKKVALMGTCNGSTWRDDLIPHLNIDYFNPVVEDWTPECQEEELRQRELCDYCLYTITPKMTGVYSIAEVVDDSNKRPDKTILLILENWEEETFDPHQIKSLQMVFNMVIGNGGYGFRRMSDLIRFLNKEE